MIFAKKVWFMLLFVALVLSACGGATQSPDDVSVMLTEGVGTMVASFFGTQTAMYTPATNTALPSQTPFMTVTPFPLSSPLASPTLVYYTATLGTLTPGTPTPTGTVFTPTVNPGSLAFGCNNLAFIRDVTIPAGTVLERNQDFVKTWKVQNNGTCNWLYQYQVVLLSGDPYGGHDFRIQRVVTPYDWSELTVWMTAPNSPGTYTNYWRMMDVEGNLFGATLVVSFRVASPTRVPPTDTSEPPTEEPTEEPTEAPTQAP